MDIIKMGYHWTFQEIFELVNNQDKIRERAGKDTVIFNAPQIRNDPKKLFFLRDCLVDVEDAMHQFAYQDIYINYLELIAFFSVDSNDTWIVEHFSNQLIMKLSYFINSLQHKCDEQNLSLVKILLNCSIFLRAEFLSKIGQNLEALNHLKQIILDDPVAKSWNVALLPIFSEDKHYLTHHYSNEKFERVVQIKTAVTLIALAKELRKQPVTNETIKQQFDYLKESLELATMSEDRFLIAKCKHSIGIVHEANNRVDISLLYEREFYEIAQEINNSDTLIEASLSLANALAKYDE
ncbi:Tetratricopeptide repeat protein 29 [Cichlidogyrus casuarinus]|uniref:Tetratricopeptide repeat protein 29 n=1 Tax=Cichlidogyrus casuarinus TaxID=1844966 RepID=A0ABD2QMT4_9PLAT